MKLAFARPMEGFSWTDAFSGGIWLPALFIPLVWVEPTHRWWVSALLLIFSAQFFFLAGSGENYPRGWSTRQRSLLVIGIQAVLILAILPAYEQYTVFFAPFVAAIISYSLSMWIGLMLVLCIGAAATGLAWLYEPRMLGMYLTLSFISPLVIYFIAQLTKTDARNSDLRHELEMIRQRESMARDVHDVVGHSLTVMTLKSEVAKRLVDHDPEAAKRELDAIAALARTSLAEARSTVTRMRNPDLQGEFAAAQRAFDTAGISAEFPADVTIAGTNAQLFSWVLREATTNILRHSAAANVRVAMSPHQLQITDDGVGFAQSDVVAGGLAGTRDRVEAAGGTLTVESSPSVGTTVRVSMTADTSPLENSL